MARGVEISGITVENGSAEGILVRGSGSVTLTDVAARQSFGAGIAVSDGSVAQLHSVSTSDNATGGLQVTANGVGVVVDDASLTVVSIPPSPSSLQGNAGGDLQLGFSARATVDGAPVEAVSCDPTVLNRGSAPCP